MWRIFLYSLSPLLLGLTEVVRAQQDPIYVPFEWSGTPLSASRVSTSGPTTTFALVDGTNITTGGPATLIQSPGGASMIYTISPTKTYSGVCNLVAPVALCTLNVYQTGQPLPSTGLPSGMHSSPSGATGVDISGARSRLSLLSPWQETVIVLGTIVFGFLISVSFLR